MKLIIEGPDHLVEFFASWLSNSGEQDLFEAYAGGRWNPEKMIHDDATTYMGSKGYGINEPVQLIEYSIETNEEV